MKADYPNPHAWRLVHLLSTMGKWIEKVIATRLLYYATRHRLIPPNQFGAMPEKLTTGAALCLAHDIHAANNHNLYTSLITFDITGYFDNVNHNRLLYTALDMQMGSIIRKQPRDQDKGGRLYRARAV